MFRGLITIFIVSFLFLPNVAKTYQKQSICFLEPEKRKAKLEEIRNRDDLIPIYVIPEVMENSGLDQTPITDRRIDMMNLMTVDRGYVFKRGEKSDLEKGDLFLEFYDFYEFGFILTFKKVQIKLGYYDGNNTFIRFYLGEEKRTTTGVECNILETALEELPPEDELRHLL